MDPSQHPVRSLFCSYAESLDWSRDRDDEGLDIDAIIEDNKQKLPEMPTGPRLMKGLKGGPLNDEEAIKSTCCRPGFQNIQLPTKNGSTVVAVRWCCASRARVFLSADRQNTRLAEWLAENGVHMSDRSGWGVPPHPLRE